MSETPAPSAVHDFTWKAVIMAFSAIGHAEAVDLIIDTYGRHSDGDDGSFVIEDPQGLLAFTVRLAVLLPPSFNRHDFEQYLGRVRATTTHDCLPALIGRMAVDRLQALVDLPATGVRRVSWALQWQQDLLNGVMGVEELAQIAFLLFNFMYPRRKQARDPRLRPAGLRRMALEIALRENSI